MTSLKSSKRRPRPPLCAPELWRSMAKFGVYRNSMNIVVSLVVGVFIGFLLGLDVGLRPGGFFSSVASSTQLENFGDTMQKMVDRSSTTQFAPKKTISVHESNNFSKIYVPTNPRGAESLPPSIVEAESDYYLRRLWGKPSEDLPMKQKYLVAFTVGAKQKSNIDAAVKKFSENFTIVLFHYDGNTTVWDEYEWSKRAIHVSVRKQAKWWYAKRFLHPDIVAAYEYIFIWDEDLGLEHFDAEEYIKVVKKHGLEISQPGLESKNRHLIWEMTKRKPGGEVHKEVEGKCPKPHWPPCAEFVEIMAPVFSRDAWRCVWHMIQNDLVHGWGLDFHLRRCVEPANEKIGVVDSQWIIHQGIPSLGNQGVAEKGKAVWFGVKERCRNEWKIFRQRMHVAQNKYYKEKGIKPPKN